MLYMVVERFKEGAASEIYRSWVDVDLTICYQLMRTEDESLFRLWTDNWKDLMKFEIVPVRISAEIVELVAKS